MLFAVVRYASDNPIEFLFVEFAHGVQFFLLHILLSISRPNLAKTLSAGFYTFFSYPAITTNILQASS